MSQEHEYELPIPREVEQSSEFVEILRVWKGPARQLFILSPEAWDDPAAWGLLLADVARHLAKAYTQRGHREQEAFERILLGWKIELESPTD